MTTTLMDRPADIDAHLIVRAETLRERAEHLRRQADGMDAVLASTFRRRAAELELEAWANEVRSGRPIDEITPIAA